MPTLAIGFVSVVNLFALHLTRGEREDGLLLLETEDDDGRRLRDDIVEQFASLCNLALHRLVRETRSPLRTLRAAEGYGRAVHRKDWLELNCEILVEEHELAEAYRFLQDPEAAGTLDSHLESAAEDFFKVRFPAGLFHELSCTFYLLENPEQVRSE